ncbi:hypothetical protein BCS42_02690 [Crenothrix sp. D3]|jgi:hypothetical protein|nr:hypothetical protein BCS42_02690 [Crenothrix sp. D3]
MSSPITLLKKYRILLLIVGLLVLSVSQQKFIMPLIYDVIKSDLFLVDSKDKGSDLPVSTSLSNLAFMHCNNYIKSKATPNESISFAEKPLRAWDIGNYEYVINAEINVTSNSVPTTKKYTCRIVYDNGDNQEGLLDIKNWSIVGVSDLQ